MGRAGGADAARDVHGALEELLVEPVDARGVSHHLLDEGTRGQMREYAALRSVYHLKEADPHAWVIPRLRGRAKAALVAVEFDEFGGGRPEMTHQGLYADLLDDLGLDPSYGAYVDAAPAGVSGRRAYLNGLLTNLLNPKMVTFTIAFLPQFIDPGLGHVWAQFAILGAVLIALEFLVDGTVGVLAGRIGDWLRRRHTARRRLNATVGTLFIGLGVRLAAER
ncbi:hypothetical protein GCM10023178_76930 [Actinomadura luteofluorescens]